MPDIADAIESYMIAKRKVKEWEKEFKRNYYRPALDMMVGMAIEGAKRSPNVDQDKLMSKLSPKAQDLFRGE